MMQSALTILLAATAMFIIDPAAGARLADPGAVRGLIAQRYGRRARPALQEVQQRIAELTADVEENDRRRARRQGVRARGPPAASASRRASRASSTRRWSRRGCSAFYSRCIGFLPQIGLAAVLFFGGRRVIDGRLDLGEFTAFYVYLLMLLGPMRTLGMSLGLAQRATRVGRAAVRDPRPRAGDRRAAGAPVRCRRATGASSCATSRSRYERRGEPGAGRRHADVDGGRDGRARRRRPARARRRSSQLISRLYDVDRRRGAGRRRRRARRRPARAAPRDRGRRRRPVPVQRDRAENIAYAGARGAAARRSIAAARRAQAHEFIMRCPTATTRASASAG